MTPRTMAWRLLRPAFDSQAPVAECTNPSTTSLLLHDSLLCIYLLCRQTPQPASPVGVALRAVQITGAHHEAQRAPAAATASRLQRHTARPAPATAPGRPYRTRPVRRTSEVVTWTRSRTGPTALAVADSLCRRQHPRYLSHRARARCQPS